MADDVLQTAVSVHGHTIRVTYKQWAHITENHDYMSGNLDKVLETLAEPSRIAGRIVGAA
jgi:YD repeat-containing protein